MQYTLRLFLLIIFCSVSLVLSQVNIIYAQRVKNEYLDEGSVPQDYTIRQGFDMNLWMSNRGVIGRIAGGQANPTDGRLGLEYPINSGIEHLLGAGLWIGAIIDTSNTESQSEWFPKNSGTNVNLNGICRAQRFYYEGMFFAVGDSGIILCSSDNGYSWNKIPSPTDRSLNAVNFTTFNSGILVGEDGIILKVIHNGFEFFVDSIPATNSDSSKKTLRDVYMVPFPANVGLAVGDSGIILRTTNRGVSWIIFDRGRVNYNLYSCWFTDLVRMYVAGDSGTILKYQTGSWRKKSPPDEFLKTNFKSMFFFSDTGFIVGENGAIAVTKNAGEYWIALQSNVNITLRDILFGQTTDFDRRIGWVVGDSGVILKTTDYGEHWIRQESGTTRNLRHVFALDENTVVVVGDSGTILTTTGSPPARVKAVTTSFDGGDPPVFEMFGNPNGSDSFFTTSIYNQNGKNSRGVDDDGDGKIDEDPFDGIDNDGDGLIDEDYGAISENDVMVSYTDYYNVPPVQGHIPLGLRVWQRSYTWGNNLQRPIIFLEYLIKNEGQKVLDSVYIGFFADGNVGPVDNAGYETRNYSVYMDSLRTAYIHNPIDTSSSPIGVTVIRTQKPLDSLGYTFQWYSKSEIPLTDADRYHMMSSSGIKPNESGLSDTRFLLSFGSFGKLYPTNTLRVTFAIVSGDSISHGINNLKENVQWAIKSNRRGYIQPIVPPSPPLRLTEENQRVKLDWSWHPTDRYCNPEETWDDSNKYVETYCDLTHWRRINPPCSGVDTCSQGMSHKCVGGKLPGGRIFEGYNVWRSEASEFLPNSFQKIDSFDVADDLNYGPQTGIQYTLIDSTIIPNHIYWYAVTSYTLPDITILPFKDPITGEIRYDTLWSSGSESWIGMNASSILVTDVNLNSDIVPSEFKLWQAYPNPSNPNTLLKYSIPRTEKVTLKVYDILGREAATLVNEKQEPGTYTVEFDGSQFSSGVYFYRLEAGSFNDIKKLILLR